MAVIPARTAGVKEIILTTPPQKTGRYPRLHWRRPASPGGRVFSVGGAQAIAALAYGTESIPAVDKVYGPGNIYVTLAKKMVYGTVGIDGCMVPARLLSSPMKRLTPFTWPPTF